MNDWDLVIDGGDVCLSGNGCLWRGVVVRLEEQGADAPDSLLLCRCEV